MSENRNLFITIAISLAIMFGWQLLVAPHFKPPATATSPSGTAQSAADLQASKGAAPTAAPGAAPGAVAYVDRSAALAKAAKRVTIASDTMSGSINLKGGNIDDLSLDKYLETLAPDSPPVTLLSPVGARDAYFVEFGFTAPQGSDLAAPGIDTEWTAPADARLTPTTPVVLTYDNGKGLVFSRTITLDQHYLFSITDKVENRTGGTVTLNPYGIVHRIGTPQILGNYLIHEGAIGILGSGTLSQAKYKDMRDKPDQQFDATQKGWLGFTDKYFATIMVPRTPGFKPGFFSLKNGNDDEYQAGYLGTAVTLAPGASATTANALFAGPKEVKLVNAYEDARDGAIPQFNLLIDWGWFYFLTKPMFWLIDWLYGLIGNFGLAILAVTVIVKLIMFPLANKSYASMSKMKLVQPAMNDIKEKFPDDKTKQQQEIMELYKREKINPLAGCLPVFVQIPVFFSLYKVLYITIEMRHAPFWGWIHDLSAPDPTNFFTLLGYLPFSLTGDFLHLGVWPLIMGITMWIQMKLNPTPPDPTQAMIFNWMPLIFMFSLGTFPAGLVIYWAWNNTLSILQQSVIMKRHGAKIELFDNLKTTFRPKKKEPA